LYRTSIILAVAVLAVVVSGAAVTSGHDHPLSWMPAAHEFVAFSSLLLAGFLFVTARRAALVWFCAAMLVELALGFMPSAAFIHACVAPFVVALAALTAFSNSPSWQRDPDFVQDYGWPSLRSLSTAAALLVVIQMGFGAAIRHLSTGVLWHLLGALVVALFIIIVGVFTTNQFPKHSALRPLAMWFMIIAGVQVFLGMTAFLMRMMNLTGTRLGLISTIAHVTIGNLTFAAAVLLAAEIRRSVRPRATAE
jgi:hypothetical protein